MPALYDWATEDGEIRPSVVDRLRGWAGPNWPLVSILLDMGEFAFILATVLL